MTLFPSLEDKSEVIEGETVFYWNEADDDQK